MKIAEVIKPQAPKTALDMEQDQITRAADELKKRRAELATKRAQARARLAQQRQAALVHASP